MNTLEILAELGFTYHIDDLSADEPFLQIINGLTTVTQARPRSPAPYLEHASFPFGRAASPLGSDLPPAGLAQSVDTEDHEAECGQQHQELAERLIAQGQQRLVDAAGLGCPVGDCRVDHQHAG